MTDKAKVVVAGDASVGKTALLTKFLFNVFVYDYNFTVGIDFHSKPVTLKKGEVVRLQLWDTAGQERFRALLPSYLRDCCAIIVVYDVTNRKSFEGIEWWIDYVQKHTIRNPPIILVGMKIDFPDQREVSTAEGELMAKKHNISFFEASAATGENVDTLFEKTAEIANNSLKQKLIASSNLNLAADQRVIRSGDHVLEMSEQQKHRKCC